VRDVFLLQCRTFAHAEGKEIVQGDCCSALARCLPLCCYVVCAMAAILMHVRWRAALREFKSFALDTPVKVVARKPILLLGWHVNMSLFVVAGDGSRVSQAARAGALYAVRAAAALDSGTELHVAWSRD
jgi:hypothetical protein